MLCLSSYDAVVPGEKFLEADSTEMIGHGLHEDCRAITDQHDRPLFGSPSMESYYIIPSRVPFQVPSRSPLESLFKSLLESPLDSLFKSPLESRLKSLSNLFQVPSRVSFQVPSHVPSQVPSQILLMFPLESLFKSLLESPLESLHESLFNLLLTLLLLELHVTMVKHSTGHLVNAHLLFIMKPRISIAF
ncbi:hypothetical protein F7725_023799 [Dissostichus mawsoni]|uniref:Uncharacterized protein n=1 Tax=Dissostichus mawsoni TaxID=36200 RepID=A0A7J5Y0F8_DISMA|nr:hypothetical protein F7725_023799 [Dissostichus mawsoni]